MQGQGRLRDGLLADTNWKALTLIPLLIIGTVVLVFTLGLTAALRHQRRWNLEHPQAPEPLSPEQAADNALLEATSQLAAGYVFQQAQVTEVSEKDLLAYPTRWHGMTVRVRGNLHIEFEGSAMGLAWFTDLTDSARLPDGDYAVVATGLWLFPRLAYSVGNTPGFGHLGQSWGEFMVYELEHVGAGLEGQ